MTAQKNILPITIAILVALGIFFALAQRSPEAITSSVTTFNLETRSACTDKTGVNTDYCSEPSIVVKWTYEDNRCVAYKFYCTSGKYCSNGACIAEKVSQTQLIAPDKIFCGLNQECILDGSQSSCTNCDQFRWKIKEKYPGCEDSSLPTPMDACFDTVLPGKKVAYTFTELGEYSAELQALRGSLILDMQPVKLNVVYAYERTPTAEVKEAILPAEKEVFFGNFWDNLKKAFGF